MALQATSVKHAGGIFKRIKYPLASLHENQAKILRSTKPGQYIDSN